MGQPPNERPEFRLGVRLHNEGEHYEAHEAWERVWRDEEDEGARRFLQGLIQVTAGCHKIVVDGMPSAGRRLLERGLEKLSASPDMAYGVDVAAFRSAVRAWIESLAGGAPVDRTTTPRILHRE